MTPTNNPMPTIRSDVDQQRANEQLRQAILDKKQAQIEAWSVQIEQMQLSLESAAESVRAETEKRLAELRQARDQAHDLFRIRIKRRRTLGSIEDTEAAGGSCAGINQSPAFGKPGRNEINRPGDRFRLFGDRGCDRRIFGVDEAHELNAAQPVQVGRVWIRRFGC